MSFQSTILTIAIIVLIIVLILIGIMLSKSSNSAVDWPPIVGDCPDYWIDTSTGSEESGSACLNTKSLGTCNIPSRSSLTPNNKDFSVAPFTGSNSTCAKYKWAKNCAVTWDGITSGIKNPCDTTAPSS